MLIKYFFSLVFLVSILMSREITPMFTLKASGLVSDFVVDKERIYVATNSGSIDIFDLKTKKIVDRIVLEPLTTSQGKSIPRAIYSVDRRNGKTLFVSSGNGGYRIVWVYENFELKKIIDIDSKIVAKKARFTDNGHILLGTFGSDIMLIDTKESYSLYHSHISQSAMGGMVLSEDKKQMLMGDESGVVRIIDVATSAIIQELPAQNLDNIYRIAYKNGTIITAGQDRKVGVYPYNKKAYHIKSNFLVYAVGLRSDGKIGVYSSGTEHNLQLFDTQTRAKKERLIGHKAVINKIEFLNPKILISAGDEQTIFIWNLE